MLTMPYVIAKLGRQFQTHGIVTIVLINAGF